ncbi:MAG TPA: hypothetical protein ENI33_06410, partial [Thermoplasmatales archaeon]|nr:hypothetical protein [Thermoplasmatales archaeon]
MKGRNQDMWIMRRMAKVAMVLVIATFMMIPTTILASEPSKPQSEPSPIAEEVTPRCISNGDPNVKPPSEIPKPRDLIPFGSEGINRETQDHVQGRDAGDILFEQLPHDPDDDWSFGTTDAGAGYKIYENFWGVNQSIGDVHWWGLTLYYSGGWIEGDPDGMNFYIEFYSDDPTDHTNIPSDLVASFDIPASEVTVTPTGQYYVGFEMYKFEVNLSDAVDLTEGWVAIQSHDDPDGDWLLWASAKTGDSFSWQEGSGPTTYDRGLVLTAAEEQGPGPGPGPGELEGNDIAIIDLTLDGKSIFDCNRFHPGMHIPDVEVINQGNVSWVYPKPEGMPDENWAGKKATLAATIWKEISEVEWEQGFEDNILGDFMVIDEDGVCCDWWNISTQRVHSGEYSMKSSRYAEYMPCQDNILQTRKPNDMSMYDEGYLEFWFWVEGDWVNTYWPYDYGYVEASDDGGETWHLLAFDIYTYDASLDVDVQIDYGVTEFYSQSEQWDTSDWLKAKVDLRDAGLELTDEMYFRWVWHSDCFVENEGWYIDDVRKVGLIHQGEVIWQAYKQVNLSAGESKHLQFEYPDLFLDAEKHHSEIYWYMVEFKNIDDDVTNDILKSDIIIEDWHDVGVIDLAIDPTYQQAPGKVDLESVTIDAVVQNFGTYVEEDVPVDLTVTNLVHQTVYYEDFEAGAMGWEHGAFGGPDLWHRTSDDAYSGSYSMGCFDDAGFYDNNMYINYLLGPVIDFEKLGAKGAELSFYAKWAMESPNDTWLIFLYDPTSNYILMHGPLATYYSRDIG